MKSGARLERILHDGTFCVTAEVVPPRSADPAAVTDQAAQLLGYADAVNVMQRRNNNRKRGRGASAGQAR